MNEIVFFPDYDQVFSGNVTEYSKVLFPIFSVNLSLINEELGECYIHLIQFNEDPYNMDTVRYFTDYCEDRIFSFSVNNGLYKLNTNLKYFDRSEDWEEWFEKTKKSYLNAKSRHDNKEKVINDDWFKIGGEPEWMQDDETPLDPDGIPMVFIAQFDTLYLFDDDCPKTIYLFYSPKHRLAVQLYQIT